MPFHTPLRTLRRPWGKLAYRLHPPAVLVPGAPHVLLLHGLGGDQEDWRGVAEHLPAAWQIALMDFRGHGRSSAPEAGFDLNDLAGDLLDVLHALSIRECHLVGYGVGGLVALQAAARTAAPVPAGAGQAPAAPPCIHGLVLIETFSSSRASAAFRPGRFQAKMPDDVRHKISQKYRDTRERFHVAFYDQFWASVIRFDAQPFLQATALPVHAVYGSDGRHAGTPARLHLPERSNLHVHWIEKTGHYLLHEQPAALAALCRRCIETVRIPDAPEIN